MQCICGASITQHAGKGRPAQFCSERCRVRAHRAKVNNVTITPALNVTKIEQHKPVRPPFSWFGGKRGLAPRLASLLPAHKVYVEVFGGSGALLFYKQPTPIEVYNDVDSALVNFFRVLRDPAQSAELQRLLTLTPYSREEWQDCRTSWQEIAEPIEQARRWYVTVMQSFSSHLDQNGWSFAKDPSNNPAGPVRNAIADFPLMVERLAKVQIEHLSYEKLLSNYDSPGTMFYCDPPYLPETRLRHGYLCEMTREDHDQMLSRLCSAQGMVMLSGYDSPLYREKLSDWQCIEVPVLNISSNTQRSKRTECIWLSPNIQRQPTLWQEVV